MQKGITEARPPDEALDALFEEASRVAARLDRRGIAGTGAGMSFLRQGRVYVTREGCDFGALGEGDFSCVTMSGRPLGNIRACPELPLHLALYRQRDDTACVLHLHSPYLSLWSCALRHNPHDAVPSPTPYLTQALGPVRLVAPEAPGDEALHDAFLSAANSSRAYLLQNRGGIVGESGISAAGIGAELLEEGAMLAWILYGREGLA